jgi:hypothetical protein
MAVYLDGRHTCYRLEIRKRRSVMKKGFRASPVSFVIASMAFFAAAQNAAQGKLRVYFVDVEGGQSTLFVTPEGHSLLIDTGWPDNNFRDADRIAAAAKSAGLQPDRRCGDHSLSRGPCWRGTAACATYAGGGLL